MVDEHDPDRLVDGTDMAETIAGAPETAFEPTPPQSMRNLGIAAIVALLALQAVLLVIVLRTSGDVSELRDQIAANDSGSPVDLDGLGTAGQATPGPTVGSAAPLAGNLPRFVGGGADAALGRSIGDLSGLDYYTGRRAELGAADGKARAYMIWAHWCPYCQEELPVLADWHETKAAEFVNFELVSVTTAIDETAPNPLIPYLDANSFPFPVLVDEDGSLARKFGVNAFPFWVFVAPDGTVVGRAAGAIEAGHLADVFTQLNDMASDGPAALPPGG